MKLKKSISFLLCLVLAFACLPLNTFANPVEDDCTAGISCGDLNDSGDIDFKDVSLLIRYCASWEVKINLANADVLKDDTINLKDVSIMIKFLAGWTNVRLGHLDDTETIEEATCAVGGTVKLVCRLCRSSVTVETPVVPHKFEAHSNPLYGQQQVCVYCGIFKESGIIAVPEIEDAEISIDEAIVDTYIGTIDYEDQVIVYSFAAEESGVYYAWVSSILQGQTVNLFIIDDEGYTVASAYDCRRDRGIYFTLEEGKTYSLKVKQYSGTGTCEISLGKQTPTVDVTDYNLINDSIVFEKQQNNYEYVAKVSGLYRFWVKECRQGFSANLFVFDDEGYTVASAYDCRRDRGMYFMLEEGKTYTFRVSQYGDHGDYTVAIGAQKPTVDITDFNIIYDSIQFENQVNLYTFTAKSSETDIWVRRISADQSITINVLDKDGYSVNTYYDMSEDDILELKGLEEGETYTIQIKQYSNLGIYEFVLSPYYEIVYD